MGVHGDIYGYIVVCRALGFPRPRLLPGIRGLRFKGLYRGHLFMETQTWRLWVTVYGLGFKAVSRWGLPSPPAT